jgi:hypothetical protein
MLIRKYTREEVHQLYWVSVWMLFAVSLVGWIVAFRSGGGLYGSTAVFCHGLAILIAAFITRWRPNTTGQFLLIWGAVSAALTVAALAASIAFGI